MRRAMHRYLVCTALAAGLSLSAAPAAGAQGDGALRLAHLSPDTPSVDVYVDNVADPSARITLAGVGYGAVSDYQDVPVGTYTVSFRAAGADPASPPVLSTTVDVAPDSAHTVAGVGFFASLSLTVFDDDLSLPRSGSARVRVVSGATPTVDVSAGSTSVASQLAMGKAGGYVEVPAGQTALQVTPAGGSPVDVRLGLDAGSVYSLLVLDREGGGLTVQAVLDASSMPVVPQGGVETGAGGTSTGSRVLPAAVSALAALGLLATFAVRTKMKLRAREKIMRDAERPELRSHLRQRSRHGAAKSASREPFRRPAECGRPAYICRLRREAPGITG